MYILRNCQGAERKNKENYLKDKKRKKKKNGAVPVCKSSQSDFICSVSQVNVYKRGF